MLVAPPGAGKTTRVPLVLIDEPWAKDRKILVLEPRRLAARAAAERMAKTLGEKVGDTVGLRVRFGSKVSRKTRIEVVTEGIFTRMILDDPRLEGRRRGAVRRIPRALARCRSRPRARARRAAGPARGSEASRHVGDARRRAGRRSCWAMRRWSKARAAPFRSRRAISPAIARAHSSRRSPMR